MLGLLLRHARRSFSALPPPNNALVTQTSQLSSVSSILDRLILGDPASLRIKEAHSKVLNLGKYVFEIIRHEVKPGCHQKYIPLMLSSIDEVAMEYREQMAQGGEESGEPSLFGSWRTVLGPLDEFGKHNFSNLQ